jgi:RNA polymerase sigma-70 factor (ECF subfamily)
MLKRLAKVFVRTDSVAEELVQDTWLGVLQGIAAFENKSAFKTWLVSILMNRARTRGLVESRSTPMSAMAGNREDGAPAVPADRFGADGMWAVPPAPWTDETPRGLLLRKEAMGILDQALTELPATQRMVVTLHDVDDLDPDEICDLLSISPGNQRVLLHRGRARLRLMLEERLGRD